VLADAAPVPSGIPGWLTAGLIGLVVGAAVVVGVVWLVRSRRR